MKVEKYFAQLKLSNRIKLFQFLIGAKITNIQRHFKSKTAFEESRTQFAKYNVSKDFFANYNDAPISIVLNNKLTITFSYFSYTRDVIARVNNNGVFHLGLEGLFISDYALSLTESEQHLADCLEVPIVGLKLIKKENADVGLQIDFKNQSSLILGNQGKAGIQLGGDDELNGLGYEIVGVSDLGYEGLLCENLIEYDLDKKGKIYVGALNNSIATLKNIDYLKQIKEALRQDGVDILDVQLLVNQENEIKLLEPYDINRNGDTQVTEKVLDAIITKMQHQKN